MSEATRVDSALDRGPVDVTRSPSARRRPLGLGEVRLQPGFWRRRQEVNAAVSLPAGWSQLEAAGTLENFRIAAGRSAGRFTGPPFHDTDLYKWLEAAGWQLGSGPLPELEREIEVAVGLIAAAQGDDGYVDTFIQLTAPERRWLDLDWSHELYNAGHLIQAAIAVSRTTGDAALLDVATRFADLAGREFGTDGRHQVDGHPEIETALVELYRQTGDRRHLDLAAFFVDGRGQGWLGRGTHGGPAYFQDHVPVRSAPSMDGHSVRQLYLLAGVVDLYLETGERALLEAAAGQWDDMVRRMVYVTGGVGSQHFGEAFGEGWELPNGSAYCETCAAIASVMLSWRLLLATGSSRYADLMERTLFNGFLSGVSLDGGRYFYVNPLLSLGTDAVLGRTRVERFPWHDCACCPPNVMRLLASLQHYLVTRDEGGLQVQQYAPMSVRTAVGGSAVALTMATEYPWDGDVSIVVEDAAGDAPWELSLRVPDWCAEPRLTVNGAPADARVSDGYAVVGRTWRAGDVVRWSVPMPARLTEAHPRVDAARGSVAVERGPIVYCFEQTDQPAGVSVLDAELDVSRPLSAAWQADVLDGVVVVEAEGSAPPAGVAEPLYAPLGTWRQRPRTPVRLRAIPYYAWANRGPAAMRVWIPRSGW
ncbi:MAG TPA: beta-L-arabinofuranosidase domain-containing protein [Candidatus Dormibacteraeota bacterium]|nr:beta-L-arabinofuranosidase domain-containing protein [Candidatus Dormibacteraeota bacterium]